MAIDITTGHFESGKRYVTFRETGAGAGEQQLISKDNTTAKQHFLIWAAWLGCATGSKVAIFDGSGKAVPVLGLNAGADVTMGTLAQGWDFGSDPIDLTNEDGTSLCISATGTFNGFIKWGFGV